MEKVILGVTEKCLGHNAVIGHSQHGFTMGKSCLTSLVSFFGTVTHLIDRGKPVDMGSQILGKLLILSNSIHLDKMSSIQPDKSIICWVNNWLMSWAQRITVNEVPSGWRPMGIPRAQFQCQCSSMFFVNDLDAEFKCTLS